MTTMIETVARAICDHEWNGTQPPFDCKPPSFGARYRATARAVLLALAEAELSEGQIDRATNLGIATYTDIFRAILKAAAEEKS